MKHFFIIFYFFIIYGSASAQVNIEKTHIDPKLDSNFYSISDALNKDNSLSLFFFCPIKNIDTTEYLLKIKDVISDHRVNLLKDLKIHVIFFKQSGKSHNGGLLVNTIDSSFHISQIECYIAKYDTLNLKRTNSIDRFNNTYKASVINKKSILCKVEIIDSVICFKSYSDRISFYSDFVFEVISPNYSDREIIDFLRKEIDVLSSKVAKLEQEFSKIDQGCKNK